MNPKSKKQSKPRNTIKSTNAIVSLLMMSFGSTACFDVADNPNEPSQDAQNEAAAMANEESKDEPTEIQQEDPEELEQRDTTQAEAPEELENNNNPDEDMECEISFLSNSYSGVAGQNVTIKWDSNRYPGSQVFIGLFSGWGSVYYFMAFTNNEGSHTLNLPANLDPNIEYTIYIESAEGGERTTICWDYAKLRLNPTDDEKEPCNRKDDAWENINTHRTTRPAGTHSMAAEVFDVQNAYFGLLTSIDVNGNLKPADNKGTEAWQGQAPQLLAG